ncbi:uncharacterized protein F5891DRAFT_1198935 [Suillus fuscotomentosus]|uniref:Amidase domain-containing protein n=1 Tax=Suillus fuscotomentosus TaxID=1912939 RepID=A0AAD4DQ40_9AGAM|nr:uncharacterized protein F5891DRAFT_1198935 [Suillus fuscotomentosus]KAG1888993.1 hypothetical protein F5891DRAFT_1198935 [Suillus fuscotomentosus]
MRSSRVEANPIALSQAAALDDERKDKGDGPLHGIPSLLKDSVVTLHEEGMDTIAGSYALLASVVPWHPGLVPDYMKARHKRPQRRSFWNASFFICDIKIIEEAFNSSLDIVRALGAKIVDPTDFLDTEELSTSKAEKRLLDVDLPFKKRLSELVDVPTGVKTLAALIEFNEKRNMFLRRIFKRKP